MKKMVICEKCHNGTSEYEIVAGKTYRSKKTIRYYCKQCMEKILKWQDVREEWEKRYNSTK